MEPLLTFKHLRFHRDEFVLAIDHLELHPDQLYVLQGANGAGKSTLLQLLALLLVPDQGEVLFKGEAVSGRNERQRLRRQITLVEQNPFLFDTSVQKNLAFGLRLRNIHGDLQKKRITQALQMVGLEGFETRRAQALSGGETRRVALARALVLRPQLLLLDEPTAGLDAGVLPIFERCLAELRGKGTCIVIAGHDADQAHRLQAEVIHLERGGLIPPPTGAPTLIKENV